MPGPVREATLGTNRMADGSRESWLGPAHGRPLDSTTRSYFEPRFGFDFSNVRVHDDHRAHAAADALGANAFTVGQSIAFAEGKHAPSTLDGRRLMAHELAHAIQQRGVGAPATGLLPTSRVEDPGEREADRAVGDVLAGRPATIANVATAPVVQREPTKPRAVTGGAVITDIGAHMPASTPTKLTAGRIAASEWESLFSRHFTEPDIDLDTESSHPRYIYSKIYGWIDAMHFFAHIQYAEDSGLAGATAKGIEIEQNQQLVRKMFVEPTASDPIGYTAMLESNLMDPTSFDYYREGSVMAAETFMPTFMDAQQKRLVSGFSDDQWDKFVLDNAYSAFSYEDLVSDQLGVHFFQMYGAEINAGATDADVRSRFVARIERFFQLIGVVDDPSEVTKRAAKLPGKERYTAPKRSVADVKSKQPELYEFDKTWKLRVAVYDTFALADKYKADVALKLPASAPALVVEPYGPSRYAVYTEPLTRFEATAWKFQIDHVASTGPGGSLVVPL